MRDRLIAILIVFILIAMLISFLNSEYYIKYQIDKADYCDTKEDCVDAGGKCPFGCYVYVNEEEVDRISSKIENYDSNCVYGCVRCSDVACIDGRCEPVCK